MFYCKLISSKCLMLSGQTFVLLFGLYLQNKRGMHMVPWNLLYLEDLLRSGLRNGCVNLLQWNSSFFHLCVYLANPYRFLQFFKYINFNKFTRQKLIYRIKQVHENVMAKLELHGTFICCHGSQLLSVE